MSNADEIGLCCKERTISTEIVSQDGFDFLVVYEDSLFCKISLSGDVFDRFTEGGREAMLKYLAINHKIGTMLGTDLLHEWFREEAKKRHNREWGIKNSGVNVR
jgi:hypothetical protein